jgi:hypothetical protein
MGEECTVATCAAGGLWERRWVAAAIGAFSWGLQGSLRKEDPSPSFCRSQTLLLTDNNNQNENNVHGERVHDDKECMICTGRR